MPVNSVEPVRSYPTPNEANDVSYDFPRLRTAITLIGQDVGALLASVAGKSNVGHGHAIADVSGLDAALDGKSNVGHNHALGTLTDVNLSGAASGQFLGLVSGTWQPVTITPAGIGAIAAAASTPTGLALLGATDVPAARTALGLGSWALLSAARATSGDANATIAGTTFLHAVTASLTAPRTLTLPLASANSLPYIIVVDEARGVSATNTLTIQTAGGDLVNGVSNIVLNTPGASAIIARNGADRWTALSTGGGGGNTFTAYRYNATGTSISGADLSGASLSYTPGLLLVMVNGSVLRSEEYTATNGTSITISTLVSGDEVMVIAFSSFTVANALRIDGGNAPTANIPMGGFRLTNLGLASAGTDALSRNAGDARYPTGDAVQSFSGAQLKQIGDNLALADLLGQNRIINGGFQFWQRGTSQTTPGYGSADRWRQGSNGGTVTTSRQSFGLNDVLGSGITPQFFLRQTVSGQSAAGDQALIQHRIEGARSYSGQTVTLSFWARRSSGAGNIAVELFQDFGTGGSPSSPVGAGANTTVLTGSWARYALTFSVPSVAARTFGSNGDDFLGVQFWVSAGSNFNASTNSLGIQTIGVDIWGVMINRGSTALEYIERPITIEEMLCRRYYRVLTNLAGGANAAAGGLSFPTVYALAPPMRAAPIVGLGTFSTTNTTVSSGGSNPEAFILQNISGAAGAMFWNNTSVTTLSSEL